MTITDKRVLQELNKSKCYQVIENITTFPTSEIDNQTDLQIAINEVDYELSLYEKDSDTLTLKEYQQAKQFLKETKNGTIIPCELIGFTPILKYTKEELQSNLDVAKDVIYDYKRLQKLHRRLKEMF